MDFYYNHREFLDFAKENNIEYDIFTQIFNAFEKYLNRVEEQEEVDLDRIRFKFQNACLRKNLNHLIKRGSIPQAVKFSRDNDIYSIKLAKIMEQSNIEDFFGYGLQEDLELEKGDCGKCIISFNPRANSFIFNVSRMGDITPRDTSKQGLRKFFKNGLEHYVGFHKNIGRDGSVLGGGAYFVKDGQKIFVDYKSGDFGEMNKGVLSKCLEEAGLKLMTLDDNYFDTTPLNEYLESFLQIQKKEERSREEIRFQELPEDDIPF